MIKLCIIIAITCCRTRQTIKYLDHVMISWGARAPVPPRTLRLCLTDRHPAVGGLRSNWHLVCRSLSRSVPSPFSMFEFFCCIFLNCNFSLNMYCTLSRELVLAALAEQPLAGTHTCVALGGYSWQPGSSNWIFSSQSRAAIMWPQKLQPPCWKRPLSFLPFSTSCPPVAGLQDCATSLGYIGFS